MTRKDYEKIAAILKQSHDETRQMAAYNKRGYLARYAQMETLRNRMADMLAADNPRFDRARFLKACGLEG